MDPASLSFLATLAFAAFRAKSDEEVHWRAAWDLFLYYKRVRGEASDADLVLWDQMMERNEPAPSPFKIEVEPWAHQVQFYRAHLTLDPTTATVRVFILPFGHSAPPPARNLCTLPANLNVDSFRAWLEGDGIQALLRELEVFEGIDSTGASVWQMSPDPHLLEEIQRLDIDVAPRDVIRIQLLDYPGHALHVWQGKTFATIVDEILEQARMRHEVVNRADLVEALWSMINGWYDRRRDGLWVTPENLETLTGIIQSRLDARRPRRR